MGNGVSLIDKNWFLKCLPDQKISIIFTFLQIREMSAFKHKSAVLSSYFLGKNNTGQLVIRFLQVRDLPG